MINVTETADKFFELSRKLLNDCKSNINELLKENKGEITWDYEELDEYGLIPITMAYDGENHPEYASNCFSSVWGVSLNHDEEILVDTDDGNIWLSSCTDTREVYELWNFLDMLVKCQKENN